MSLTPAADTQPQPILNPLTRYQFIAGLAKALAKSSLDSKNFKSHSFWIGAATTLALQGETQQVI